MKSDRAFLSASCVNSICINFKAVEQLQQMSYTIGYGIVLYSFWNYWYLGSQTILERGANWTPISLEHYVIDWEESCIIGKFNISLSSTLPGDHVKVKQTFLVIKKPNTIHSACKCALHSFKCRISATFLGFHKGQKATILINTFDKWLVQWHHY